MLRERNKWTNIFHGIRLQKTVYVMKNEKLKTFNVAIEKIYCLNSLRVRIYKTYITKQNVHN